MLFNTLDFWLFFVLVYGVYRVLGTRAQNLWLLGASYVFYAFWDYRFVFLLALSTSIDWLLARRISRETSREGPAYDSVIQAWSGFMSVTGTRETGPLKAGPPIIDYSTGLAAAYAVSAALFQRQRTGKGQFIDLSMLDTNIILMASVVTAYLNTGAAPKPAGNDAASRSPASTTFNTADGLLAFAINEEHQYQGMLQVLGLQALNDDPRFATAAARREHIPALRALMQQKLMARSAFDWETALNAAGVPAGRVRTIPECLADAQTASRSLFHSFPPEVTGFAKDLKVPLSPFSFAHDGPRADTPPRPVGADSDAILGELGYDAEMIAALRDKKII